MRFYLNAGFGHRIGAADLTLIRELGFQGVRQDLPPNEELALIREFAPGQPGAGLRPLFLVNGGKMLEGPGAAGGRAAQVALMMHDLGVAGEIEIGNEPNIARNPYRDDPAALAESLCIAYDIMKRDPRIMDTRLVSGGIMTTDKDGLSYLERLVSLLPPGVFVGFHTYRTTVPPQTAHKGFSNRFSEFHRLAAIVGGRQLWNTEIGWHTAESKVGCWPFGKKVRFTDSQVAQFLCDEAQYNIASGVKVMTIFQLNDGPNDEYEHRFGIRRLDGTIKPSALVPGRFA